MSVFMFNANFATYTSNMYPRKKIILIRTQLSDKLMYHFCNIYIYIYIYLTYVVNVLSRISIVMLICKTFIMKFVLPLAFSIKKLLVEVEQI